MREHLPGVLPRLTLSDVTGQWMRDREWEARERGYHEEAIREINALVRKYNGVAPYAVRRTYLTREGELQRTYELAGEDILAALKRRREAGPAGDVAIWGLDAGHAESGQGGGGGGGEVQPIVFGLRAMWKRWVAKFIG
jgi:DnaJ homolog subfamily C member 28